MKNHFYEVFIVLQYRKMCARPQRENKKCQFYCLHILVHLLLSSEGEGCERSFAGMENPTKARVVQ